MSENSTELLDTVRKMHDLLALLAEDKIAQRDAKLRDQLLQIVGNSKPKQKSVFLMDGTRTQKEIRDEVSVNQGNFSVMVGKLSAAKLLICDTKSPKLAISIPTNFFENHAKTK